MDIMEDESMKNARQTNINKNLVLEETLFKHASY